MPGQEVVVVRHGETEWSRDGRHTGKSDIPLTSQGREQARRLAKVLRAWNFALVLTSPLQRARDTCKLAGFADRAEARPGLEEWDYGSYDGQTTREIKQSQPNWSLWRDGGPGGETVADVGRRVDPIIHELQRSDGNVLIFAHGHVLRVLTARWLGEPAKAAQHYALETAGIGVLGYEHEYPVIRRWNLPVD